MGVLNIIHDLENMNDKGTQRTQADFWHSLQQPAVNIHNELASSHQ